MTEKISEQDLEIGAHNLAHSMLYKIIECQPQLLASNRIHDEGGTSSGEFLNNLYDQLVILHRKNLKAVGI